MLRLISKEDDLRAGLALAASLRKRLTHLPGNLAADEGLRVRTLSPDSCGAKQAAVVVCGQALKCPLQAVRHLRAAPRLVKSGSTMFKCCSAGRRLLALQPGPRRTCKCSAGAERHASLAASHKT